MSNAPPTAPVYTVSNFNSLLGAGRTRASPDRGLTDVGGRARAAPEAGGRSAAGSPGGRSGSTGWREPGSAGWRRGRSVR
ncbi:hypothetical protein BOC58_03295 [Burkholderia pseudomallei]|nr:hypothetical protein BOC58_03295 [Burkholderia pseudomallei]